MQHSSLSRPLLFLSDVHLGGFSEERNHRIERELINLIDYCENNGIQIFVLGDLFDYWMEYPTYIPELGANLKERFNQYNRVMGPTLYITGNHDNWTRSYFQSIGFTVERKYRQLKRGDQTLLLLHGDGLIDEQGTMIRPAMHRLLRNKTFIKYYQKILPPRAGISLMRWFSRVNRFFGPLKEDTQVLDDWAQQMLRNTVNDFIFCGHDHAPRRLNFSYGSYLNIGTFYKHRSLVLYNNEGAELVVWSDTSKQLKPFTTA